MRLSKFEYERPSTLNQACALLDEGKDAVSVVAGGTDLFVRMKQRVSSPDLVVDINDIDELRGISEEDGEITIGAAVTLGEIHRSPLIQASAAPLAESALAVGAAQLQNMGTIGGNLCLATRCWYYQQTESWRQTRPPCFKTGGAVCYMVKRSKRCHALYSGDTAAALLALGASVRIVSVSGVRTLALENFFVDDGVRNTVLQPGELITGIAIPSQLNGRRAIYLKYRKRGSIDYPLAGVAAVLAKDSETIRSLRVAVTGVGSLPFLVAGCDSLFKDQVITANLIDSLSEMVWKQTRPVSRMEVSPSYRKHLVRVLARDALNYLTGLVELAPSTCLKNHL